MLLSVIVSSYRSENHLENFFKSFIQQSNAMKDIFGFELILVADFIQPNELVLIKKYRQIIRNFKLIANSKRMGRSICNYDGLNISESKYCIFLSPTDSLNQNFAEEIVKQVQGEDFDVIEFRTSFQGLVTWTPNLRVLTKEPVSVKLNPNIITKTLPIEFNKVWRTSFLKENWKKVYNEPNSRFNIINFYTLLPKIERYLTLPKVLTTTFIPRDSMFTSLPLFRSWDQILDYYSKNFKNLNDEIMYSYLYHSLIFCMIFTLATKNSILIKRQILQLIDKNEEIKQIRDLNPYLNINSKESDIMRDLPSENQYAKILKGAL